MTLSRTLSFLLLAAPGWAAGPSIEFKETVRDFGSLPEGATVQHSFSFRNGGDAPLVISSVNTSCGCAAAYPSAKTVAPGKKGRVDVTFDSAGRPGETDKRFRVWSNDPARPLVVLTLKGTVVPAAPGMGRPAPDCGADAPCSDDPGGAVK